MVFGVPRYTARRVASVAPEAHGQALALPNQGGWLTLATVLRQSFLGFLFVWEGSGVQCEGPPLDHQCKPLDAEEQAIVLIRGK